MKFVERIISFVVILSTATVAFGDQPAGRAKVVLAVHGGAGVVPKARMTAQLKDQYEKELTNALRAGYEALQRQSGTSLDGVEAAIKVMEDSPLFNAGKGAVFTHEGRIELDASIMEGRDLRAGSVACVTRLRNPISAARAVMEKSNHVMMIGEGAERFAVGVGVREANPVDFWTEERWKELLEELRRERLGKQDPHSMSRQTKIHHFGTVGAVALDRHGNLAAGTSTGGLLNKRFGRVGDSPIIGAGTYADDSACAVSCTGEGEIFIRYVVAHEITGLMKWKGLSVQDAVGQALGRLPKQPGGVGGAIALDARGNVAMGFDTEGMYRGTISDQGDIKIIIYKD